MHEHMSCELNNKSEYIQSANKGFSLCLKKINASFSAPVCTAQKGFDKSKGAYGEDMLTRWQLASNQNEIGHFQIFRSLF